MSYLPRNRERARRSFLVGRAAAGMKAAGSSASRSRCAVRAARLSAVSSYSVCAIAALPRCGTTRRTVTMCTNAPSRTRTVSPGFSSLLRFARSPFTSIFPPSIAAAASERVLKNRAAHSHLSRRMLKRSSIPTYNLHWRLLFGTVTLWAACGDPLPRAGGTDAAQLPPEAVAAVRAEALRAAAVAGRPRTGRWDVDRIAERLLRAGVNPRASDTLPPQPGFLGAPEVAQFRIGRSATLAVYLYQDSAARRAVSAMLDPETAAPPGIPSPWGLDPLPITSVNLLAVLTGGSSAMRERVQLAIEAGLPPADTIR